MLPEMTAALDEADADDSVCAIITGTGERAFRSGADLSTGDATFDYATGERWSDAGSPMGAMPISPHISSPAFANAASVTFWAGGIPRES